MRDDSDKVFWERLAEMPVIEQEQECVLRREHVALRLAMLHGEKVAAEDRHDKREASRIGVAMFEDNAQITVLNERIKYLRRLLEAISWRNAVKAVLGQEAYEQVVLWRVREESERLAAGYPPAKSD